MAKITQCAKCGACTTPCPVYKISGQETLAARGRLHLLDKLGSTKHSSKYNEIFSKCLLCGACYQACPRDINTPELIVNARENGAHIGGTSYFKKLLIQKGLSSPALLPLASQAIHTINKLADSLLPKDSGLRIKLALFGGGDPQHKSGFVSSLQETVLTEEHPKIVYFSGCLANYLSTDIGNSTVTCLKQICGMETIAPHQQTCCGMAAYAAGNKKEAQGLAKKNILAFNTLPFADLPIITSCATCYAHLRSYPNLFKDDAEWQKKAIQYSERVCEFSSFLLENARADFQFVEQGRLKTNIFYHDPCHLRFTADKSGAIVNEPRMLLAKIPNLSIRELPDGPQCCGQGGLFNIAHPEDSDQICSSLINSIITTQAEMVVTTCSGCLMQIHAGLARHKSTITAQHLALFLQQYLDLPTEQSSLP